MLRDQREALEKSLTEAREALKMIEVLENNDGWQWVKQQLLAKVESQRAMAMQRESADQMARDLGYMAALLDVIRLPEDKAKVLRMQLANSKL